VRIVDGYVGPTCPGRSGASECALHQRREIAAWTRGHGWQVAQVFQEAPGPGETPGPLLRRALRRVEARESDGIVVATLTTLATDLAGALAAIERIEAAGAAFVSIADGLDLRRREGRRMLQLLLTVADWPGGGARRELDAG